MSRLRSELQTPEIIGTCVPGFVFGSLSRLELRFAFIASFLLRGTQDVEIWERHARDVREHGLIGYYHGDTSANHPPFIIIASPARWPQAAHAPILFYLENSWKIALALVVILSCLRRRRRSIVDLGATIAMSYVLVYALNGGFSFQYFAWSLPLWFFLSTWFLIPAAVLTSAYVYALYWYLCGNPWLLGAWDFNGHPYWPSLIVGLRNPAYLFFFA